MGEELDQTIRIDLRLRSYVEHQLAPLCLDPKDAEPSSEDLQPDHFEQVLGLSGQTTEAVQQFVANQRDLVLVPGARESLVENQALGDVADVVLGQPADCLLYTSPSPRDRG